VYRRVFSHRVCSSKGDEKATWIFAEEHWFNVLSKTAWKLFISSRETETGSARRREAVSEAFAIANWWVAIVCR